VAQTLNWQPPRCPTCFWYDLNDVMVMHVIYFWSSAERGFVKFPLSRDCFQYCTVRWSSRLLHFSVIEYYTIWKYYSLFNYAVVPSFMHLFSCWWTFGLFPVLDYYRYCQTIFQNGGTSWYSWQCVRSPSLPTPRLVSLYNFSDSGRWVVVSHGFIISWWLKM